ncbi:MULTISPECIES: glutathione S-transferase family protein [unclassified Mesorhizobium]|uniref:glutathione S-transferase family protein n=1 Tax=unclassified Mesorhizobium TaxID=325217 RepID=UPI000FCA6988|nr:MULTISPECIES: glutathione S-transferase family protein [unclassified Mesorhizobium]TGP27149.1 glutathione S-transferase family protein [Mesorhizobium sp. M1D.F.Ca.ET.231.01.1.1]TGP39107.1 glutathione S-transferase family protein [Mesorhizobium sp. M1D.F.Ca.ET.234.01.1.1]TGS51315.1 glutathione S-transferase family protein [Mesorhizobium sp. M1D.F.Ca.ET.184.01.1.1]TGS67199.1 glutathione S-transferase family protein [Mesorhizobium sp. M1D.F.Ca.ET.183.01.1.1]
MEPILLYGFPAGSSMGLVAAFELAGQPYRLCRVDMLADMKNDAYASLNGRQETPVLITDEGKVLTETMAIAAWLEARDVERRISFDPRRPEADRMHQLMAFVNTGFTAAFSPLWAVLEMASPEPLLQATLRDFGRKAVADRHDRLEAMIADTDFLVGDKLTLADTTLIGVARWAEFHQAIDGGHYPKLAALRRRIEADPAVRYALAVEDGERPAGSGACLGHVPLADVIERFAA